MWRGFGRTLGFALLAAGGWPAFGLVAAPLLGTSAALSLYLVGVAGVYVAGLGRSAREAVGAALLAGALGAGVMLLAPDPRFAALGAAALIALVRGRRLPHRRPARGLASEALLLGAGLAVASQLAGPTAFEIGLAIWAFFLVQSLAFLVGGAGQGRDPAAELDPFDAARARLVQLLEDGG